MSFRCFSFIFLYETVKLSREYERHSSYAKRSKNTVALARNVLVARELRVVALQGGVEVFWPVIRSLLQTFIVYSDAAMVSFQEQQFYSLKFLRSRTKYTRKPPEAPNRPSEERTELNNFPRSYSTPTYSDALKKWKTTVRINFQSSDKLCLGSQMFVPRKDMKEG